MTALPLTAQTTGLFNAAMFAKFKKGAIFINVAREEEQVDADLAAALESGQVSSTGQDSVVPNSPLWKEKNIIITPHVAAQNVDAMLSRGGEQIWAVARENLKRFINGDKMLSVIDPVKGY
jgi:phosphoglycerate dehydrogenase-like enzyme